MSNKITQITIFLSSPSDVEKEGKAVKKVIDSINSFINRYEAWNLKLFHYKTDVYPSLMGDPQNTVNIQTPEYEIYFCILWSRFGTKTKKYGSGTEEEFYNALEKMRSNPHNLEMMVYFKEAKLPMNVDTEQLNKVRSFRATIEALGIIYPFKNIGQFETAIYKHLVDCASNLYRSINGNNNMDKMEIIKEMESHMKFHIEYIYKGDERIKKIEEIMTSFTEYSNSTTVHYNNKMKSISPQEKYKLSLQEAEDFSNKIEGCADEIKDNILKFSVNFKNAIESLSKAKALNRLLEISDSELEHYTPNLELRFEEGIRANDKFIIQLNETIVLAPIFKVTINKLIVAIKIISKEYQFCINLLKDSALGHVT